MNEVSSSLVWPEHNRVVSERLHELFNNGQLVDVAVTCGHTQLFAHRAVLAAASPVFLTQLQHNPGPYVQIQLDALLEGCTVQEMHNLLEFIYSGEVCVSQHRLTVFLNIARQLQLVGFHEGSLHNNCNSIHNTQSPRTVIVPSRPPLHVLALPEPPPLPTPALSATELQTFLPQLPITIPTFPITETQSTIPSQHLESDIVSQEDPYMGNNFVPDNSLSGVTALGKYYHQENSEAPIKYCEKFKSDNCNVRNLSGSLTNATFSDLCSADPDLGLILFGDNRSLNSTLRHVFTDTSEICPSTCQENSYPKDYSQGNLKMLPSEVNEESECAQGTVISDQLQGLSMDWSVLTNGTFPVAESLHSGTQTNYVQQYQSEFIIFHHHIFLEYIYKNNTYIIEIYILLYFYVS